jgi:hypothetical protein
MTISVLEEPEMNKTEEVYMDIKTEYDKMAQLILEADDAVAIIPLLNRDEWDVYSAIVKLYEAGHNVVTDGLEIPTTGITLQMIYETITGEHDSTLTDDDAQKLLDAIEKVFDYDAAIKSKNGSITGKMLNGSLFLCRHSNHGAIIPEKTFIQLCAEPLLLID